MTLWQISRFSSNYFSSRRSISENTPPHLPAIIKVVNHYSQNRFIKPQAPQLIKAIWVFPENSTLKLLMWKRPRQVCRHPTLKTIRLTNKSYIHFTVRAEEMLGPWISLSQAIQFHGNTKSRIPLNPRKTLAAIIPSSIRIIFHYDPRQSSNLFKPIKLKNKALNTKVFMFL